MANFIEKIEDGCKVADKILCSDNDSYILSVERHVSKHLKKLLKYAPKLDAKANYGTHEQQCHTGTAHQQVGIIKYST